jgi:hypothetical protein
VWPNGYLLRLRLDYFRCSQCFDIDESPSGATAPPPPPPSPSPTDDSDGRLRKLLEAPSTGYCPACPPCDGCPPCPVSYCDWEDTEPCDFPGNLSKTFSWEGIGCNEALSQIDIKGEILMRL